MPRQIGKRHLRHLSTIVHIQDRVQLHQVHIALFGLRQQNDGRGIFGTFACLGRDIAKVHLTTDDRLHALFGRVL